VKINGIDGLFGRDYSGRAVAAVMVAFGKTVSSNGGGIN